MRKIDPIRISLLALLALALGASAYAADALSGEERQRLISELEESRDLVREAVRGLSSEQLDFRPSPFTWSISDIVDHITVAEHGLMNLVTERMTKELGQAPAQSSAAAPAEQVDVEEILRWLIARERKVQSPVVARPAGKWGSARETLKAFVKRRDQAIDFVRSTEKDLHAAIRPNPIWGPMDAYRWLFFTSGHARRHIVQISELKAHPEFPR